MNSNGRRFWLKIAAGGLAYTTGGLWIHGHACDERATRLQSELTRFDRDVEKYGHAAVHNRDFYVPYWYGGRYLKEPEARAELERQAQRARKINALFHPFSSLCVSNQ